MRRFSIPLILFVMALGVAGGFFVQDIIRPVQAQSAFCDQSVAISVAAAQTQTIIVGLSGARVRVCAFVITGDTLATTAIFESAGTDLTGAMRMCDECDISLGNGTGVLFEGVLNENLTIAAVTGAVTGVVRFGRN